MTAPYRLVLWSVIMAGGLAIRVLAQDVNVTDPVWALSDPAPQQIPKAKSRLRPSFPDEMRSAAEPGYVLVTRYVDGDGKSLSSRIFSTHVAYQRAVEAALRGWEMSGAIRDGKSVPGEVWTAAIFNPKSASAKTANATPRLLAVTPIISPRPPFEKGGPRIVVMHLKIDAKGSITESTPDVEINARALTAIKAGLETWRFAPARKDGQPIAAEFTMTVFCQGVSAIDRGQVIPPKVLKQVSAEYPLRMRASRMRGEVALVFDVDVDGSVNNPVVTRSNNPGFDEAAIDCVRKWKFKPGTRDDQPAKLKTGVTIIFQITSTDPSFEANDAYTVNEAANQSKLPPEMRYDTAAKIRGTVAAVYPYALKRDRVRGTAKVALGIDGNGRVVQSKVVEATRPEFGLATLAAVETFTFDPALRKSTPVPSILRYVQEFSSDEPADSVGDDLLSLEKKHPEKILGAGKLDSPLRAVSQKSPVFPRALYGKVTTGKAVIEILIDENGHVRLPKVFSTTDELFGYAAVQAINAWLFEPPMSGGKKVITRAQVPFMFSAPADSVEHQSETATPLPEK